MAQQVLHELMFLFEGVGNLLEYEIARSEFKRPSGSDSAPAVMLPYLWRYVDRSPFQ